MGVLRNALFLERSNKGLRGLVAAGTVMVVVLGTLASAQTPPPGGNFRDDDGNVHEGAIEAIAREGITLGCNPPDNDLYCPGESVARGEMAAFLRRAFALPSTDNDFFNDDSDSVFEDDINALAAAGITSGCNPPDNTEFCPEESVSRGAMAAFLRRAFEYPASSTDYFVDDNSSIFELDINSVAEAGVTRGCNPPENDEYCPTEDVRRDEMASFLARALGLPTPEPPPPTSTSTTSSTSSTTSTTRPGNCDPAYPTVCIPPPPPDLDCGDIRHSNFRVLPPDPHNFDADGNGYGCEGN